MKRLWLIAALPLLAATGPVSAEPKVDRGDGSFFNKPGATAEQATSEVASCRALAEGADSQINGINVITGGLGAIIGGAFAGGRLKRINIENCMLVRGWNLYAMTRDEGAKWEALSESARNKEIAVLVGASTPARGSLLRTWHNDYAEPALWQKD